LRRQRTSLARWQRATDDGLYISCGPSHIVKCADGQLLKLPNGTDEVWFAGDACYPEWEPGDPVEPMSLAAFNANLLTPPEVKTYTPEVQRDLLTVWIAALVSGLRPLPLLGSIGDKGGGKTTLVRAIIRTLMGPESDVSALPQDIRDFWAQITTSSLVGLDNLDSDQTPSWLLDEIANTVTGKRVETRELYTNGVKLSRAATAALAITTRTAAFCRPDIADRILPVLTEEFHVSKQLADFDLLDEVDASRDGLLSWCAVTAERLLRGRRDAPPGLPLRFVDFARLVWAYMREQGRPTAAAHMLLALRRAQALTVGEADPLIEAIAVHFHDIATDGLWSGRPSELVAALTAAGADLPYLGGGKRIARRLRESRRTLEIANIEFSEHRSGHGVVFDLVAVGESGEFYVGQTLQGIQESADDDDLEVF